MVKGKDKGTWKQKLTANDEVGENGEEEECGYANRSYKLICKRNTVRESSFNGSFRRPHTEMPGVPLPNHGDALLVNGPTVDLV